MHMELTDYCLTILSQLSVSGKMTELHLLCAFVVKTAKQSLKVISLDLNVNPFLQADKQTDFTSNTAKRYLNLPTFELNC